MDKLEPTPTVQRVIDDFEMAVTNNSVKGLLISAEDLRDFLVWIGNLYAEATECVKIKIERQNGNAPRTKDLAGVLPSSSVGTETSGTEKE